MGGRRGECSERQGLGRLFAPTGSCLVSGHPSSFDLYRWVECVSKEHQACISRKGEKDSREGKSLFRGVAGPVYRDRDQTHREETGGGGDTQVNVGHA